MHDKLYDMSKNWALVEGLHSCREILLAFSDHIVIGMHSGEYDNGRVEYPFQLLTKWDLDGCALVKIPMKYVRTFMTLAEVESYYRNRDFYEATWARAS